MIECMMITCKTTINFVVKVIMVLSILLVLKDCVWTLTIIQEYIFPILTGTGRVMSVIQKTSVYMISDQSLSLSVVVRILDNGKDR